MKTDDVGSLQVTPKRLRVWGDDHTDTMLEKKAAMEQGIVLDRPINYTPQHRRSARGIVAGVILGLGVWLLLAGVAVMVWRML